MPRPCFVTVPLQAVEVLLEGGAEVEWSDEEGYTPLHMAAGYVHPGCVRMLLDRGADPEAEDGQGRSSLSLAKELLEKLPNNPMAVRRCLPRLACQKPEALATRC